MKVLLVKTSSLGDVVHSYPAISDAARAVPDLQLDWLVEEAFEPLAALHPAVVNTLTIALRRWRKQPLQFRELPGFIRRLRAQHYDRIIDAQGLLIKSAMPTRWARGDERWGFDSGSIRDPRAARVLDHSVSIGRERHAIERTRMLFAQALGYAMPSSAPDFGLPVSVQASDPYILALHGTTWRNKHWPQTHWRGLIRQALDAGYRVRLPWGNATERDSALWLAGETGAEVLPKTSLPDMVDCLSGAAGVVGVDSGLLHLSAALNRPTLALYGPTDPKRTGVLGGRARSLAPTYPCAPCLRRRCRYRVGAVAEWPPCLAALAPATVWQTLATLMDTQPSMSL